MPTNFERSKAVIKKLIPQARKNIRNRDVSVEDMVKKRLNQLSQGYGNRLLHDGREPVDYQMVTTHIAYCYRTLTAHGDWLTKAMECASDACSELISDKKLVRVSSIGGGPGSDILGVLKFAKRNCLDDRKYRFAVLDREPAWDKTRELLVDTFKDEIDVAAKPVAFDATRNGNWVSSWKFADADIVTLSFFLSEVWSFNKDGSVSAFLQRLIDKASVGTIFVYIDNGGQEFSPRVDAEFSRDDIDILAAGSDDRLLLNFDEQCDVLGDYRASFGQLPKLTGNVAWRVWRKSGG